MDAPQISLSMSNHNIIEDSDDDETPLQRFDLIANPLVFTDKSLPNVYLIHWSDEKDADAPWRRILETEYLENLSR